MGKLLVVLVLMIGVIAIAQMMRVYEISSKLRGKKEEEISHRDNVFNANMMLVFMVAFYAFFFWLMAKYGDGGLGPSASLHGETLDWLLDFNFLIIIIVFFLTNTLLFVFAYKYYHRPGRKAYWFPHNNKLELLWTSVPAVVLAIIIILGLRAWNDITDYAAKKSTVIEIYSKQFDWTARYSGKDNKLGRADFRMNSAENPLGVLTHIGAEQRMDGLSNEVVEVGVRLYMSERDRGQIVDNINDKVLNREIKYKTGEEDKSLSTTFNKLRATNEEYKNFLPKTYREELMTALEIIDKNATTNVLNAYEVMSDKQAGEMNDKFQRLQRHVIKLMAVAKSLSEKDNQAAMDDKVVKELVLIKGQEYEFKMRSMDVIHSAFFPHFRAQMNTVPGMVTRFKFTPIYTTEEMRDKMGNEKFDYVLLCNKICGAAHQNMQMKVTVVKDAKEYEAFLATAKSMGEVLMPPAAAPDPATTDTTNTATVTDTVNVAAVGNK